MSDRNYISFTQNAEGIWQRILDLDPVLLFPTGTPRYLRRVVFDHDLDPRPRGNGSDTIKVSDRVDGLDLEFNGDVVGWDEDVIDINAKARDITARFNKRAHITGRFLATLKGESDNLRLWFNEISGFPKEVMFDLGNRSEQAKGRTKNMYIHVEDSVFQPVTCRVLHAWRPHLSGNVKWKVDTSKMGWIARFFWLFPYIFGK